MIWKPGPGEMLLARVPVTFATGAAMRVRELDSYHLEDLSVEDLWLWKSLFRPTPPSAGASAGQPGGRPVADGRGSPGVRPPGARR
ncbi:hypothetical protein [Streptomyces rubrogriseus]|uniref:hypothetical protein n=1 Tax=Streptomyces rubrogriseus TaxID=194673 RepID=UPI00368E161E